MKSKFFMLIALLCSYAQAVVVTEMSSREIYLNSCMERGLYGLIIMYIAIFIGSLMARPIVGPFKKPKQDEFKSEENPLKILLSIVVFILQIVFYVYFVKGYVDNFFPYISYWVFGIVASLAVFFFTLLNKGVIVSMFNIPKLTYNEDTCGGVSIPRGRGRPVDHLEEVKQDLRDRGMRFPGEP